jgi:hypothetical protein
MERKNGLIDPSGRPTGRCYPTRACSLLLLAAALFGELFLNPGGLLGEELIYPLHWGFKRRPYFNLSTFNINNQGLSATSYHFVWKWERGELKT